MAEIGAQVASALEAAHQAGIVHRDVKPGNVMVPATGTAKLADFGIASLQGDPQLTSTGLVIGSPAYMAPEQAKGEESGPPTDFWALGATMFYAVEGEPPFDRGTSIATLAAVVNNPPRDLRRAGPLTPLITALLSKDPAPRPSGPELWAELARPATPAPSPTHRGPPTHGPGRTVPPSSVRSHRGAGGGTEAGAGGGAGGWAAGPGGGGGGWGGGRSGLSTGQALGLWTAGSTQPPARLRSPTGGPRSRRAGVPSCRTGAHPRPTRRRPTRRPNPGARTRAAGLPPAPVVERGGGGGWSPCSACWRWWGW